MDRETVRPKDGLQLRKVGPQFMIVEACEGNVNMSNVYSLNQTAARLWEWTVQGNYTPEELAERLCEVYDTDKETALHDVERQIADWKSYGLIL